jgi:predicted small lipoprotein YifL
MRRSNRGLRAVTALVAIVLVAGCGSGPATPPPSASVTPVATPDPHLAAPAHVDDVFRLVGSAGLKLIPNTASEGTRGDPIKRITATYADWPLVLTEFSSTNALRNIGKFDPSERPQRGEAPYIVAGLNILVEYGPRNTNDPLPQPADDVHQKALASLVAALDPLLGPLAQRSVVTIALPGTPAPASQPPAAAQASPGS